MCEKAVALPLMCVFFKGCSSIRNKSQRFVYDPCTGPGPGDYDPKYIEKGCKVPPPKCHGKGKLYVCRVPYSVKVVGPSIPGHGDEDGYDMDAEGDLVKMTRPRCKCPVGPNSYYLPSVSVYKLLYKRLELTKHGYFYITLI